MLLCRQFGTLLCSTVLNYWLCRKPIWKIRKSWQYQRQAIIREPRRECHKAGHYLAIVLLQLFPKFCTLQKVLTETVLPQDLLLFMYCSVHLHEESHRVLCLYGNGCRFINSQLSDPSCRIFISGWDIASPKLLRGNNKRCSCNNSVILHRAQSN